MCENRFGYPEASQNLSLAFVFIKSPAAFILFTPWLGDVAENITSRRMQNIYAHVRCQNIPRAA